MRGALLIGLCLAAVLEGGDIDIESIAKKFEQLGAWRLPATSGYVNYDPFRRAKPLIKQTKRRKIAPRSPVIRVTAIMNDRAFVNGRWTKKGDRVGPYRIVAVRRSGVLVKEGGRTLFLPLKHETKLLKIKETEQ